jgi:hypothetical protein
MSALSRVGGFWYKDVALRPNERVLRSEGAFASPFYLTGRLYLTNERLIWTPARIVPVLGFALRAPLSIEVSRIEECKTRKRVVAMPQKPLSVRTSESTRNFLIGMRYTKSSVTEWIDAINAAARAARGQS